jgi:MFS family permease
MIKEMFMGATPSNFKINPIVKAFITAEMFIWSAWNAIIPIIAIYVTTIPNGNVETAATSYSVYLISRVIFELTSGRILLNSGERKKFVLTVIGIIIVSVSYLTFLWADNVFFLFLAYAISGCGIGIASPAKNSLFATHLDKNKEAMEWSFLDAGVFFCMALASTLGGFIAHQYGFKILFVISAVINILGILPYILYAKSVKKLKIF